MIRRSNRPKIGADRQVSNCELAIRIKLPWGRNLSAFSSENQVNTSYIAAFVRKVMLRYCISLAQSAVFHSVQGGGVNFDLRSDRSISCHALREHFALS